MAGCTMNGERKIIMAKYRKLGRTSAQRKALLRNQVTAVINNGKIVTTEAKAKEVQKIVDGLIALAVKEKDNFETVKVTTKVARKDKDGKRVKQIVDKETGKVLAESHRDKDGKLVKIENGVTVTVYDEVEKEIKKDLPTRSHARRQMLKVLNPVVEVPADAAGKKRTPRKLTWLQSSSMSMLPSMLPVRVVTPESLRSVSVRVTQL
ncbi:Ribosomal protein L17 [human gut metagenome]|uniref:Ribosomal protein L17 n=1 Tax=human gut metagenome TaxID=408170 RepID=K1T7Y4_9ZZZZ